MKRTNGLSRYRKNNTWIKQAGKDFISICLLHLFHPRAILLFF